MTCAYVAEFIDAIAAGEMSAASDVAAHLSSCPACAASLQAARTLDGLLRSRPAPAAPAQFTSRVMNRLRRASWRREQIVDAIFNAAMIAAAMIVVTGLGIALNRAGLSFVSRDAMQVFGSGMLAAAQKVAPSLPLYAGATGLIVVALGLWWWASDSAAL
jgi:anti-sigma factor RsiW